MKKLTILSYLIAFILFIAGCNTSTNNSSNNPVSSSDSESKQGSSGEKVEVVNIEKDEISIEDEQDEDSVKKHVIPFEMGDFILSITPSGEIDSAGGVYYSYEIKNNSSIPVKEMRLDVKLEFEDGQSLVDNISIYDTIMNGEFSGDSNETVYPEPASKIKSYQLIGYQIIDKEDNVYNVDMQLNLVQEN